MTQPVGKRIRELDQADQINDDTRLVVNRSAQEADEQITIATLRAEVREPGPAGPQGVRGQQGPPGQDGQDGPQGPAGVRGPAGPAGPKGDTGADSAVAGPPGPEGPRGSQGPRGVAGATGPAGPQGDPGPTGPEGPEGPTGDGRLSYRQTGSYSAAQVNGASFQESVEADETKMYFEFVDGDDLIGMEVRVAAIPTGQAQRFAQTAHGNNSPEIRLQRTTAGDGSHRIRLSGAAGGWSRVTVFAVSAQGVPGPAGPEGPAGGPGPQGPAGPRGAQGDRGPAGPQGDQGERGPAGPASTVPGPQGPRGAQGPRGDQGAASTVPGPQGEQGPKGDQGDRGPAGPQGPQGEQGDRGPAGPAGGGRKVGSASPSSTGTWEGSGYTIPADVGEDQMFLCSYHDAGEVSDHNFVVGGRFMAAVRATEAVVEGNSPGSAGLQLEAGRRWGRTAAFELVVTSRGASGERFVLFQVA